MTGAVELTGLRKAFGTTEVLGGISLSVADGEFVSLLGPSGCGKTTLLRIVAGLEAPSAGTVTIGGRDVTRLPPERRDIAMMFQSYALLPHLSVAENVRFPLRMRRIGSREEQEARVRAALETVQLGALAERRPRQLSGGQQQRVALARAIVSKPKVLLLDEPLSNLDARLREDMQVELIEIHQKTGLTTLFVTHDQEEALSLSDRVVLINAGRIEQQGAPEALYARPETGFASDFLGSANLVPAEIVDGPEGPEARLGDGGRVRLSPDEPRRGRARLVLRQEDLVLTPPGPGEGLAGTVKARVYLGARTRYVVATAGADLRVLAGNDAPFAAGDAVRLVIDPRRVRTVSPD
ncbi:heme ABC exporter ATP-binding protein CcmA [Prosthecomicrobium sp. N25]|uniref:heme ABC exporter ATP-binding protein CcmA n=1 Tax=Prosthecomicrobium sp. N25 TaxID=3129254 RepID=UPI00307715F2